jgi:hypothetical protein
VPSTARFTRFASHPKLDGSHAILPPSSPAWLRYTEEKLIERLATAEAAALGTELHETAARNIKRGLEMKPDGKYPVLAAYVNDAIELGMTPEQMLFYTINCYGTADTIGFDEIELFLRIHDLKTGVSKASKDQLYVYAALFCLEYEYKPFEINGELRIYQGEVICYELDRGYLAQVYDAIRVSNRIIEQRRMGELA